MKTDSSSADESSASKSSAAENSAAAEPARISEEAVAHVARLARLHVTPEEQQMFSQQLSSVLDYGKEMEDLNLADIPPTSHPYQLQNVLRADKAAEGSDRSEVLAVAPEAQDNQFRVPPVLEQ